MYDASMPFAHRVTGKVDLRKIETNVDGSLTKEAGLERTKELGKELDNLQELLFAAGSHSLLIVLQGRDTAGKDGAIRGLSRYLNIQGVHVTGFKVPTPEELAHDYLWRIHPHAPGKGSVAIFNRSHYEDVLVVRVHELAPEAVWKKRYEQINEFESLLTSANTIVVKFCLHISKSEQEQRLLDREKEPEKAWKLSAGDWKERDFWDQYTDAYNDALSKCNAEDRPWYVISADKKWYRDLAVTETLVETLRPYRGEWMTKLEKMGEKAKAELAAMRSGTPTPSKG